MVINRRRAPSSAISSEKKLSGHIREADYALLIGGTSISGVQKGDVKDTFGNLHSVKSGKKWQVFLYGYQRISASTNLKILKNCLDAFTINAKKYFEDRTKCIAYKEAYIEKYGREKAKSLKNIDVETALGKNEYIESKNQLAKYTFDVRDKLKNKDALRAFLNEAIFNNDEVTFLAIKDTTYLNDNLFKVFAKEDVLNILCNQLFPEVSKSRNVPEDFNVAAQKTLLCYLKNSKVKNIVEIEIRNDSETHYRQVRFNMYSKDVLSLLMDSKNKLNVKKINDGVLVYGKAVELLCL